MLSVVGDDGEAGATPVIAATRSSQKPTQTQTHTRRRSASWNATFYSNTIVPALSDSNALSSFITSLTYPTDAAKSSLNNKKPSKLTGVDEDAEDIINQIALAPDLHGGYHKRRKAVEADFCPPPVAGYTTTFDPKSITRPKTLRSQTLPFTLFTRQPEPNLKTSKSTRDSQSLEPFYAAVDARSTGNISATSLPPPPTTKLAIFYNGGYESQLLINATGYATKAKYALVQKQLKFALQQKGLLDKFQLLDFQELGTPAPNPKSQFESTTYLRVFVQADSEVSMTHATLSIPKTHY